MRSFPEGLLPFAVRLIWRVESGSEQLWRWSHTLLQRLSPLRGFGETFVCLRCRMVFGIERIEQGMCPSCHGYLIYRLEQLLHLGQMTLNNTFVCLGQCGGLWTAVPTGFCPGCNSAQIVPLDTVVGRRHATTRQPVATTAP